MPRHLAPCLVGLLLSSSATQSTQAGLFKCVQPDGEIVYQQTGCTGSAQGGALEVDTRPLGGTGPSPKGLDLSVEGQLKAMESARNKERRARAKGAAEADRDVPADTRDKAKCAKHRAESARWRQAVRKGYRNQDEKTYQREKLKEHQTLVERYCGAQ